MRNKKCHSPLSAVAATRQFEVQREIESFLRALSSYPDRFSRDPRLSFEQHLFSIMASEPTSAGGQHRVH